MKDVSAYSVLAAGYDVVMEHVDYDLWASHVYGFLQDYAPDAKTILELGCGTGSFALALRYLQRYQYAGTDLSDKMVRVARAKAELEGADIQFAQADFTNFSVDQPVDVVLLLFDGLNYLLKDGGVDQLFRCAFAALKPGGIMVVDQSTPANSVNNEAYFEDRGEAEGFSYVRTSSYNSETGIHSTVFEIEALGKQFREEHLQRAYSRAEVQAAANRAGFVIEGGFEDFGREPATDSSERIHWVLRRPEK